MTQIDKHALLSEHILFRDLEPAEIQRIAKLGVTRQLDTEDVLFLKGAPGDALYGVLSGRIRISISDRAGREIVLNVMEPGDLFGEIALLDGKPRTAHATAIGPTELLKIHRVDFVRLLEAQPHLTVHLLRMVCDRVRTANECVEDYVFLPLPARLAKRLLSLSKFYSGPEETSEGLPMSQPELGRLLGTTRETINRQLQVWRKSGWIELTQGRIKIIDPDALEASIDVHAET